MSLYNPEKEIGEHFQFMGDHTKFPRWITHVVFGESFMNDTSKRLFKLNAQHPSALKLSIALESWRIFSKKWILVKAAQKAHTDIYAYHTHLYEFTEPDENGQLKLTDEQKDIASDWVFMNNTIVSSIAKRNIKDHFYDLKWVFSSKNESNQ